MIAGFLDYLSLEKAYSPHTVMSYENDLKAFAAYLEQTHLPLYRKVRERNPDLPIIIFGRTTRDYDHEDVLRRKVTERTYEIALAEGDKNVYYVNPLDTFPIAPEEATVDRIHPTDFGFYLMAKALEPTLREIAKKYQ